MSNAVKRFRESQYQVLVGLSHPERLEGLMRIAAVFARRQRGRIVAASVVVVPADADLSHPADYADPEQLVNAETMVRRAEDFGAELGISVDPVVEFGHDIATAIAALCERLNADMVLLGYSPPQEAGDDTDVPARITEQVASMTGPLLAILALPEGPEPARLLIPVTEGLDPMIVRDLAKIVGLFGGAEVTFIGLLPRGLDRQEFSSRSQALRARLEDVELDEVRCLDVDGREATHCLFGAEARQMAGDSHEAAFIMRATI